MNQIPSISHYLEKYASGAMATIFVIALIGLLIGSLVWVYYDAEERGKGGCLLTIVIALFAWPVGLLIWLLARPELTSRRTYDLNSAPSCSRCGHTISKGVIECPYCGSPRL